MMVIVHIGLEKTGTTSLQKFLSINQTIFKASQYTYPEFLKSENHKALLALLSDDGVVVRKLLQIDREEFLRLRVLLSEWILDRVEQGCIPVFSSEFISSRLSKQIQIHDFHQQLSSVSTKTEYICFVRSLLPLVLSRYSTSVRAGSVNRLLENDFLKVISSRKHQNLVRLWSDSVPTNMRFCVYPERQSNQTLYDTFLSALPIQPDHDVLKYPNQINRGLSANNLEVMRRFNQLAGLKEPRNITLKMKRNVEEHLIILGKIDPPFCFSRKTYELAAQSFKNEFDFLKPFLDEEAFWQLTNPWAGFQEDGVFDFEESVVEDRLRQVLP